jgi:hypothetical protein
MAAGTHRERSTPEVFESHLRLRQRWRLEGDLAENYADEIVLICVFGAYCGKDSIRSSARRLGLQLPDARFEFVSKQIAGEYAFLTWRAVSDRYRAEDGADTFVIRGGRIVMQSIRYTLYSSSGERIDGDAASL